MSTLSEKFSDFLDKKIDSSNFNWIENRLLISPGQIKDLLEEFINKKYEIVTNKNIVQ